MTADPNPRASASRRTARTARTRTARTRTAVAALCGAAVLLAAGCSGTTKKSTSGGGGAAPSKSSAAAPSANPNATLKPGLKLAFLPKQVNNPYEKIVDNAGIAAAKEFGGTAKEVGPSDASASSQVSYINSLAQQRQNAILIAANDPNAVCGPLNAARKNGTKVVSYDSDTAPQCRDLFINQADSATIGRIEVQNLAKMIGYQGQIAILSATQNATNQNTWIRYMKDELTKPAYKNMKLVSIAYGNDDDQKSFTDTQGLLQSYPKLRGIIAPTTVGIAAAARYLDGSRYKGKVVLTGLGTPDQMRKFVKDGTVRKFSLWDPGKLGYLAAYAAGALASGQITGKEGEKFKAGKLGEYTVRAGGEVVLGPPTDFTASNIDDFHF